MADLLRLTGGIVPSERLPQRMKTYSFSKPLWIYFRLYICSGLFLELPTDNHRLPPIYESMAMCQVTDIWMVYSLTVWCWGVNTFVWTWQKVSSDGYDIAAPWHYCSHWEVCRRIQDTESLFLFLFHIHTQTHSHVHSHAHLRDVTGSKPNRIILQWSIKCLSTHCVLTINWARRASLRW